MFLPGPDATPLSIQRCHCNPHMSVDKTSYYMSHFRIFEGTAHLDPLLSAGWALNVSAGSHLFLL